ncbi:transcriptional repressor [Deinococcus metallilatus]|uniref:Fur family ferric uptake transcriptional regulator n=1 Tax=Deinococcus metallilatus TaxID=1211322 RepID=A0AAJ5F439_9DEIO|nr:Fur family transcriptional regulator [Deinococcus metallilatus]MBB5294852.1 Fur family ferric uptake transcriptional regulator [Deinococcus metallilatus]QBY09431.1 transcriptional repressor [Deinococcus metallilatus]RXJ09436.1 transcriptional repressor [Deinococcus metallilatus]TLK28959.1 transcriptional repressor [Deinococcus metallilatus]GMA16779.1 transcriptional repressor [Deinococcus metallilatus]
MTATRSTRQRDVITRVLDGAEGPLAVGEVLIRAQTDLPGLGVATVYRTLKLLTEQGHIHPVTLDGETRYERAGRGHHHHFSCTGCGRVFTLHTCPVALPSGTVYPGGFIVEAHEVTLYGRCPECAAAPTDA